VQQEYGEAKGYSAAFLVVIDANPTIWAWAWLNTFQNSCYIDAIDHALRACNFHDPARGSYNRNVISPYRRLSLWAAPQQLVQGTERIRTNITPPGWVSRRI
jgi:hypothetical protein